MIRSLDMFNTGDIGSNVIDKMKPGDSILIISASEQGLATGCCDYVSLCERREAFSRGYQINITLSDLDFLYKTLKQADLHETCVLIGWISEGERFVTSRNIPTSYFYNNEATIGPLPYDDFSLKIKQSLDQLAGRMFSSKSFVTICKNIKDYKDKVILVRFSEEGSKVGELTRSTLRKRITVYHLPITGEEDIIIEIRKGIRHYAIGFSSEVVLNTDCL